MKHQPPLHEIFCGELCTNNTSNNLYLHNLTYYDNDIIKPNVKIGFAKFIPDITTLQSKIIDLLELASYVYAADKLVFRGERDSLNNDGWERSFLFHIPVRDYDFWANSEIKSALSSTFEFMMGDRKVDFRFEKYKQDPLSSKSQYNLFDNEEYFAIDEPDNTEIALFSGGLDSLAGTIEYLNTNPQNHIFLVTHNANSSTINTTRKLVDYLQNKYGRNRIKHYQFQCHLMNHTKTREETQRSRMFLFSAIAFSIASCYKKRSFFVYENGITSMNIPKQADVFNSRASRTTHPKTIGLLKELYSQFFDEFIIETPFFWKTKSDILRLFIKFNEKEIITSSVSCSSTRNKPQGFYHCGRCSQCIERRFAIYAENLEDIFDNYETDFINEQIDSETKQRLYNVLHFASMKELENIHIFEEKYLNEITDIIPYIDGTNPEDKVDALYNFISKNNASTMQGAKNMRHKHDDLLHDFPEQSLLKMLSNGEILRSPIILRVSKLHIILSDAIPKLFQTERPRNEMDFNDKIEAILSNQEKYEREYPPLLFGLTKYIPDHSKDFLLIESKYIRAKTTKSKASEGIAADITKAPDVYGIFFIVYDPDRSITDDKEFIETFEKKRIDCYVRIYR